jgi:multidrug efflux pump subunit AcrB
MAENEGTEGQGTEGDGTEGSGTESGGQQQQGGPRNEVPPEVKRALAKANKEAETLRLKLKEFEDRDKSEAQKLAERATAAESAAATAQSQLLRYQVAAEKGLPAELAVRLQGGDAKELAADADKLLALLGDVKGTPPKFNGGPRKTADGKTDMNALIRSAAGLG